MPLPASTAAALLDAGIALELDAPLAYKTWWRTGGPADGFAVLQDLAELKAVQEVCAAHDCPVFVLGNASNVLVSDDGVRGMVVRLAGALAEGRAVEGTDPPVLLLGGGVKLAPLVGRMQRMGWTGLEFFAGIPGTIGGAVRMNAGTALGCVADALIDVGVVRTGGAVQTLSYGQLQLGYRTSALPEGAIVAHARFATTGTDPEESREAIRAHLERREATQPVHDSCCGSTFRNPPGDYAGRLIDTAGLKGEKLGRAQVSEKHGNFIVNLGGASAIEIRRLIEHVRSVVWSVHHVDLETEVVFAGDWSVWDPDVTL